MILIRALLGKYMLYTRPLKNEVFIFSDALTFPHYLVHLMPNGAIFSKIDQYL